ncbi:Pogo transposable element with ZNF domain [Holothuria leucospilota]|uniref:Pogo transposable element with ZNF domain n=1 Tax=Holothuria leucospilota TaxID=206669 RepID=A0A9Q1H7W3_HOLLE|nr:Pogo transposable element with ZNF domain [Holothuria leucospilota]
MASNGLDVLLLCYEEDLQPWQKAIFEKHEEAEKKHEEAIKNYKQEMKHFYAGLGVSYNKKNGEAAAMEQQVSESNNGITRLVTTLPVSQSPIANPVATPVTVQPSTKPTIKMTTKVLSSTRSVPVPVPALVPTVVSSKPKQYPPHKSQVQTTAPAPVTAVKPIPQVSSKAAAKRPVADDAPSSPEKRQAVDLNYKNDRHYGFKKGKTPSNEDGDRKFRIKCFHCDSVLSNNILYMEHIKLYLNTSRKSMKDSHLFCSDCFKRFRTPQEFEAHFERYHSTVNKYYCKICDYSFKSKSVLKTHLQGVHDPLHMPYICRVCQYRTSIHQDIMNHFSTAHKGAKALLCPHCCKILKCSRSYLQHCQRHYAVLLKNNGAFHCPCCKLQFLSSTERNEHVQTDHKKLKVSDKDGVPNYVQPMYIKPSSRPPKKKTPPSNPISNLNRKKRQEVPMECLECGGSYDDLQAHLSKLMKCSSCRYSTFCGPSFAQHTIVFHSSFKAPPKIHPVKKVSLNGGESSLTCKKCGFSTLLCPIMAWHTVSCSKGASSCESFVYLKLRQKTLFTPDEANTSSDKEVIEILSDDE